MISSGCTISLLTSSDTSEVREEKRVVTVHGPVETVSPVGKVLVTPSVLKDDVKDITLEEVDGDT